MENLYDRLATVTSMDIPVDDALRGATQQKSFFKRVDNYELLHADADTFPSRAPNDPFNVKLSEAQTRLCESLHVPSTTVVMQAAKRYLVHAVATQGCSKPCPAHMLHPNQCRTASPMPADFVLP